MGFIDDMRTRYILQPLADYLIQKNSRISSTQAVSRAVVGTPQLRDNMVFNDGVVSRKSRPMSVVPYATLRNFSVQYDIARAAINHRKRQITMLKWTITNADEDDKTDYSTQIKELRTQFKSIGGYRVRFRELLDVMVEDLLVIDAVALYKRQTRGGKFYDLQALDGATIVLRTDQSGGTPMPPEIAYKQKIRNKVVAEFTADEMYYEMMNPRTTTPYGLAPLESLILSVSTALRSDLFNLNMLADGNIPEGLYSVPETWTASDIKEYQEIWDAAIAGDAAQNNRLKFVPPGKYVPTKKPEDMRYKELQDWLMKKTCMLFDIQPQDIGITDNVNKSTGEVQQDLGKQAGTIPTAHFLEEIFTDVIQVDMGMPYLRFKFMGLETENEKQKAEVNAIRINSGQRTIDEVRKAEGLDPLGVDKPFVIGNPTFIDPESTDRRAKAAEALMTLGSDKTTAGTTEDQASSENVENGTGTDETVQKSKSIEDTHIQLVTELRGFRRYAMKRIKAGKSLKQFTSEVLPEAVTSEINRRLQDAQTQEQARDIFTEYMADYQINFLANLTNLRSDLSRVMTDESR